MSKKDVSTEIGLTWVGADAPPKAAPSSCLVRHESTPARSQREPHRRLSRRAEPRGRALGAEEVAHPQDLGERRAAPEPGDAARRPVRGRRLQQRHVQEPGRRRHGSPAEASVDLADPPGGKLQPPRVVAEVGPGPEQCPGGLAVEPVEEAVLREGVPRDGAVHPQPPHQPLLHLRAAAGPHPPHAGVEVVAKDHPDRPPRRLPEHAYVGMDSKCNGLPRSLRAPHGRKAGQDLELRAGSASIKRSGTPLHYCEGAAEHLLKTGVFGLSHGVHEAEHSSQLKRGCCLGARGPAQGHDICRLVALIATAVVVLQHRNSLRGDRRQQRRVSEPYRGECPCGAH
mmetsp:Transcript_51837/g.160802  ORF Transcript_51837/g.160802 Transcript_51837/m.160802 type:complete len:341 (-) Transcript_51837:832-1854(-)